MEVGVDVADAPRRVQLSRAKGWRMPPNTVKVDRTTRWGNPFVVVNHFPGHWDVLPPGRLYAPETFYGRREALTRAVERFRTEAAAILDLEPLRGKNLACWCALDQPCHADVLLELANA